MAKVHLLCVDGARRAHSRKSRDGAGPRESRAGRRAVARSAARQSREGRADCLRAALLQSGPKDHPLRDAEPFGSRDVRGSAHDPHRVRRADAALDGGGHDQARDPVREVRRRAVRSEREGRDDSVMKIGAMKAWILPLLLVASAAAAEAPTLKAGVFDPPRQAPDFSLQGSDGRELKVSTYRGKVVLLAFGFSSCTEVCPTTLATFADARRKLGAAASDVQVVYVTVDPERDVPERM